MKKIFALIWLFASSLAFAGTGALSDGQLVTLRAGVCADNTARAFMQAGNGPALNGWLNTTTATLGWSTRVDAGAMDEAPAMATYDSLTQGKRDSWARILDLRDGRTRDFTKNSVRNWITDVWGSATAGSNSEKILLAGTEAATRAQNVIGGTVKTTGTVSATDRGYQGIVTTPETTRLIFQANGQIYTCP